MTLSVFLLMSDFLTMMMKRKMMKTIDQTRMKIWKTKLSKIVNIEDWQKFEPTWSFLKFDVWTLRHSLVHFSLISTWTSYASSCGVILNVFWILIVHVMMKKMTKSLRKRRTTCIGGVSTTVNLVMSLQTCFFCENFASQVLLACHVHFWISTLSFSPLRCSSSSSTPYSCSDSCFSWASRPPRRTGVNIASRSWLCTRLYIQTILTRFGLVPPPSLGVEYERNGILEIAFSVLSVWTSLWIARSCFCNKISQIMYLLLRYQFKGRLCAQIFLNPLGS